MRDPTAFWIQATCPPAGAAAISDGKGAERSPSVARAVQAISKRAAELGHTSTAIAALEARVLFAQDSLPGDCTLFQGIRGNLARQLRAAGQVDRAAAIGRLDSYRDNWWCASGDEPAPDPGPLPFLSAADRTAAASERARLRKLGTAPNHLAREAVRLATARPDDPKAPEALALAVRATRYGCGDSDTGAASRRAFELLHQRYPKTEWAKRTPYWFHG